MNFRSGLVWSVLGMISIAMLIGSISFSLILGDNESDLYSAEKGWTGTSDLKETLEQREYEVTSILSTPALLYEERDPHKTVFISLGPGREYSLTEQHAISKFVSNGGRMILADDSENSLSERFNVNFVNGQLYDQNFVSNPDLLKYNVAADFFQGFILMNRPASLTFTSGQALIASTSAAWVDRNGNGINDNVTSNQGEARGIRYLCTISEPDFQEKNSGTAFFLSDPSIFMNGMIHLEGNMDFALALIEYLLPEGGKVVFDDSVHMARGAGEVYQRALMGLGKVTTDINIKIVLGSLTVLSMLAVGYIYESPKKPRHEVILERTGVAEMIEPDLMESDLDELKKAVLDRIRLSSGMSVESISSLSWNELKGLIGDDEIYRFIRTGKYRGGIERLLLEVLEWGKK